MKHCWIATICPDDATGALDGLYRSVAGDGQVDNILQAHSLRPHTLTGHLALYKNVLHHSANTVPLWLREALGVYVSMLNKCFYCVVHHSAGLTRLLQDDSRARDILQALERDEVGSALEAREAVLFDYARALTRHPGDLCASDLEPLRNGGWDDGQILEVNQVVAYFGYANRTVLGLGVNPAGETLGLSPAGADRDMTHR